MEIFNCSPPNKRLSDEAQICRLLDGLNDDCLLEVFGYLDVNDLLQVSKTDDYFKKLITKSLSKNIVFDLVSLGHGHTESYIVDILETFGKSIRKLKITCRDCISFLEILFKYFEPATLTEVDVTLSKWCMCNLNVVHRSTPFLSNVRKLRIRDKVYGKDA